MISNLIRAILAVAQFPKLFNRYQFMFGVGVALLLAGIALVSFKLAAVLIGTLLIGYSIWASRQ